MEYKTIEDLGDLNGKVVMLRADLNVPMDENFHVTNTARIDRTVPTIRLLMNKGAKVVVVSHFGRPEGKGDMKNSLSHIVSELENAVPLRYIQIRDGGKIVDFILQVSNLLNAAGIWYLEDGELDTTYMTYIKTYIKESVECIPNWFCYIT